MITRYRSFQSSIGLLAIAREPFGGGSKVFKSKAAAHLLSFLLLQYLQKRAFDAVITKKPAFRLAFEYFGGERGIRTLDKL